jgi:hypothetical protein
MATEKIQQLADEYDIPTEVVEEYIEYMGFEPDEVDSLNYYGRFSNESDFAEQLVDEGIIRDLGIYLYMTDTDMRILAGEEADNRVDNMDDEEILDETGDNYSPDEVDDAREYLKSQYYDEIYEELEKDAVQYFVDQFGYNEEDLAKQSIFRVDYDKLGDDLQYDYDYITHDGDVYVFNNYKRGGETMAKGGEVVKFTSTETKNLRNRYRFISKMERDLERLDEDSDESQELYADLTWSYSMLNKLKLKLRNKYGNTKEFRNAINKIAFDYGMTYARGGMTYRGGGIVTNLDDAFASDDMKDELKHKMKEGDQIVAFAYTDYGGDFFDKVAIEYFKENHPENIVSERTAYNGQNGIVFGEPASEFLEAYESYILGYEDMENFYYQMENEETEDSFEFFLRDLSIYGEYKVSERAMDWLMENKGGYYSMTTQGLDFSSSDLERELLEEGLIKKEDDDDDEEFTDEENYAKGGVHKVNKKYEYFAVNKKTNKIVDGWEIVDDVESLKYYAKMDLKDNDMNPSDYNLLSAKTLKARGIDPYSWDSWAKTGEYSNGGMLDNKYVPIRTDGVYGVQKRVNGISETFFAVDNKNGFDISNQLAKQVNQNKEKANISFWIDDKINAENFISKYFKGYEIEEDENNRVNIFDLEIVFADYFKNKKEVKDYLIEADDEYSNGGGVGFDQYGNPYGFDYEMDSVYEWHFKEGDKTNPYKVWDKIEGVYVAEFPNRQRAIEYIERNKYGYADGGMMAKGGMTDEKISDKVSRVNEIIRENIVMRDIDGEYDGVKYSPIKFVGGDLIITIMVKEGNKFVKYHTYKVKKSDEGFDEGRMEALNRIEKELKRKKVELFKNGGVTFDEKVKSISKSLVERKKVSPSVQKDYGKTYSKKEAIESAKRIAGAMRKKEMSKKK